jgi:hypothetical protein
MRWVIVAIVASLVGDAVADDDKPDKKQIALRLFYEGRLLYDQGKYIEACALFEKSDQLDPLVGTRLNLAECAERDEKPRTAWLLWIDAAEEFEAASDDRAKFARRRADALAPKLATVVVRVAKPRRKGLEIKIGGREVKPAPEIVDRLDKSRIVIEATAPNRVPFSTTVSVGIGDKVEVDVPALPRVPGNEPDPDERARSNPWFRAALVSGLVSAVSFGGFVLGARHIDSLERQAEAASAAMNDAELERINASGKRWANINSVIGIGFLTGTIATVVFLGKGIQVHARRRDTTSLRLTPVLAPRVAGVNLDLRW